MKGNDIRPSLNLVNRISLLKKVFLSNNMTIVAVNIVIIRNKIIISNSR